LEQADDAQIISSWHERGLVEKEYYKTVSDARKKDAEEKRIAREKEAAERASIKKHKFDEPTDDRQVKTRMQQMRDDVEELNKKIIVGNATRLANANVTAKAETEIAQRTAAAKIESLKLTSQALELASNIAGKSTEEGKALAVAATIINTYLAAQGAYASQMLITTPDAPIRAAVAAGLAIAQGLANVNAIINTPVPNGGGGSGYSSPSPQAPSIPNQSSSTVITGSDKPINTNTLNVGDTKVYVLESDITDSQKKVKKIINKATIR
jgi:hypothetical protein